MDLFPLVMAAVAAILFVIIARNLLALDRREREQRATAVKREAPAPAPPSWRTAPPHVLEELREAEAPPATAEPVAFSAYYPREAKPEEWVPMIAYVFRESAGAAVEQDAARQLGDRSGDYRAVEEDARQAVEAGATIQAIPSLPGFQFNPPSIRIGFYEDWHRFDFKMRAAGAPLNLAANGRLTFTVEGVIVADLPLSVFVGHSGAQVGQASAVRKPYDAIFCSYSRKDLQVVERIERAYKILGLEYLRDLITIRSGEDWSQALREMIERADIFQLFWSTSAAGSRHVQMEWEYALTLEHKADNFIRPVFWEQPMPPVPEPLQHIHFAYEPALDD